MIGSLRGRLLSRSPEAELLVEVAGVGYIIRATPAAAAAADPESEVFIHVCHVVREDAETLYGFATADERSTFEALLAARGVGPALAMGLLGVHTPETLRAVVATDDVDALCLVPGVGPKTAVRLLVELKSKLKLPSSDTPPTVGGAGPPPEQSIRGDVRAALGGLGYSAEEISRALVDLPEGDDSQGLLREALKRLAAPR